MECLSTMLKEGDDWLAQLAEVLEGTPDTLTTDPSPQPSLQRLDSKGTTADACCVDGAIGRRDGGACDEAGGRRARSRASFAVNGNGSRRVGYEGSAGAGSSSTRSCKRAEVVGGNGERPQRNGKVKSADTVVMKPSRPEVKRTSGTPNGAVKTPHAATRGGAVASLGCGKRATGGRASGGKGQVGEGGDRLSPRHEGARPASVSDTRVRVSRPGPHCKYLVNRFGNRVWRSKNKGLINHLGRTCSSTGPCVALLDTSRIPVARVVMLWYGVERYGLV